jgi:hypothetical protein
MLPWAHWRLVDVVSSRYSPFIGALEVTVAPSHGSGGGAEHMFFNIITAPRRSKPDSLCIPPPSWRVLPIANPIFAPSCVGKAGEGPSCGSAHPLSTAATPAGTSWAQSAGQYQLYMIWCWSMGAGGACTPEGLPGSMSELSAR